MKSFRIGQTAREDLDEVWAYFASYSVESADRFMARLMRTPQNLADMPTLGSDRSALHQGLRTFSVKKHVIYYEPHVDGITVIRVLSGWRETNAIDWSAPDLRS